MTPTTKPQLTMQVWLDDRGEIEMVAVADATQRGEQFVEATLHEAVNTHIESQ